MKLLHRALGASPSCSLVLTLEAVLCASQEDSMRRYFYFFMHTFISLPITLFLFLPSLSFAHSIIWLAQAALIFQPLERGPSITGWWEDHRQSITLYEVIHVPGHEEAPRHASRWHLPTPPSGLSLASDGLQFQRGPIWSASLCGAPSTGSPRLELPQLKCLISCSVGLQMVQSNPQAETQQWP